ncbi:MAG: vWA domain-containing protein [Gemmataceae bacterium]
MSRARLAWALSLAIHLSMIAAIYCATTHAPTAAPGMEIGTVSFEVQLGADVPRTLPAITALPLAADPVQTTFEPITQVAATDAAQPSPTPPWKGEDKNVLIPSLPGRGRGGLDSELPSGVSTVFFGVPATGASIVYVIDRSASMGLEGRLQRAAREVAASLAHLPVETRVQVIAYSRTADTLCGGPGLMPIERSLVANTSQRLAQLAPEGGTDHVRAIKAALLLEADVVYFLTDEDDLTPADVKSVTEYNRGRSVIHTICLVNPGMPNTPIQELARRNRGQFRTAK